MKNHFELILKDCMTISGPSSNVPCIFPFTFNYVTHHECLVDNDGAWCSTEVDDDGVHVSGQGKWGICGPGCPIRKYLDKLFFVSIREA